MRVSFARFFIMYGHAQASPWWNGSVNHHIMRIMWSFFCLHHQPQSLDHAAVLRAGSDDIDPGGIDAAVSQNIRQLSDVLFHTVKGAGE